MKTLLFIFSLTAILYSCDTKNVDSGQNQITDSFMADPEPVDTFNYCCGALGFEFHRNKYNMADFMGDKWQPYTTTEFGDKTAKQIIEEEFCEGCGFVNNDTSSVFSFLRVTDDSTGYIYFVKLNFRESNKDQTVYTQQIFGQIKKEFGKPADSAQWNEEKFRHFSYKWERNCCVLYYDFGGLAGKIGQVEKLQPVWLIFEAKPTNKEFQGEVISLFKRK